MKPRTQVNWNPDVAADTTQGVEVTAFGFHRDGLFLAGCLAYAVNRWMLKPFSPTGFLAWHFNDLWLIPCALPLLLWVHQKLGWRGDAPPTAREVGGHLALWSVLFEWWGPRLMSHATGDPLDVACYWVGGLVAWVWWNRHTLRAQRRSA